jgi:hypothetical protein
VFLGGEPGLESANYWLLCGCAALVVWTPLAVINGCLFLAELLYWDRPGRANKLGSSE